MQDGRITLALSLLCLLGCNDSLGISGGPGGLHSTGTAVEPCDMDPIDEVEIEDVSIDGGDILVTVSYGGGCGEHHFRVGGCGEHHFRVCWDGEFMESYPVRADLEIIHDGHGDACLALITTTLRFDLSALEEAYREEYGTDHGAIWLELDGSSILHEF
jgi:hypothetical protein